MTRQFGSCSRLRQSFLVLLALIYCGVCGKATELETVVVASEGKALLPVVVAEAAAPRVQQAAKDLAHVLGHMIKGEFRVENAGQPGILVGTVDDFVEWEPLREKFDPYDPLRREEYWIETSANGVWLVGATPLAVQHAVWDFLGGLGYRQFFPGKVWEVIPEYDRIEVARREFQSPSFHSRRIWFSSAKGWDYNSAEYKDWSKKNRAVEGFRLGTGQSYARIIQSNRRIFHENPIFYAEVEGERKYRGSSTKMNVGNTVLQKLVADFAVQYFENNRGMDAISLEPSNGGGWSEAESADYGGPSDQMLYLANQVAAAVRESFPDKYVGVLAYREHTQPPVRTRVHPGVIVSIATSFLNGGVTFDEVVKGWQEKGATLLGIRDYFSTNMWDRDLPGRPISSNIPTLMENIAHYYQLGGRFYSAQSSNNWGPNGLSHYLASRVFWDVKEAEHYWFWIDDFLNKAFAGAEVPMRRFYENIHHISGRPLLSEDLIGQLYRDLAEARKLAEGREDILGRLDHLILYVHYVELYRQYSGARGAQRQDAFEQLMRYVWRIRKTGMVHALELYRDLGRRDKQVSIPDGATWEVEEKDNPWKKSSFPDRAEIERILAEGIQNNQLKGFVSVVYSEELIPAAKALGISLEQYPQISEPKLTLRGERAFYLWAENSPTEFRFKATTGKMGDTGVKAEIRLMTQIDGESVIVDEFFLPNDQQTYEVTLRTDRKGLHVVQVRDFGALTTLTWADGTGPVQVENTDLTTLPYGPSSSYFYVPKGTRIVGGFGGGKGRIVDSQGNELLNFESIAPDQGHFSIAVPKGEDGKLWSLRDNTGPRILLTIPSYFVSNPMDLLLPREVVEADASVIP